MMNRTEQGVLHQSRVINLLTQILWLITFCLSQAIVADTSHEKTSQPGKHITLVYTAESTLHSQIANQVTASLSQQYSGLEISEIKLPDKNIVSNNKTGLVVAIGTDSIQTANTYFHNSRKLLIASNPAAYTPGEKQDSQSAVLYMTQPYCRQIQFITLINNRWNTVGYLSNRIRPVDNKAILRCAKQYGITTYNVSTSPDERLTSNIKDLLSHSDLLLALPDNTIYNSKSVKNILLTSYRQRKPLIAFSQSFVNAGALASIYSSTGQIADSAIRLVKQHLEQGRGFTKTVNYPENFDISFNSQVFRALDLEIPDADEIKHAIDIKEKEKAGDH